ncbi:UNVERIFIED_CONTAM: hypothetical protein RMT77_013792 [Armadillidium vulgare]
MPKRTFPFEESVVIQQKIHVGERQVNEGIMKEENMKKVFNHTLQILFNASKRSFKNEIDDCLNNNRATQNAHFLTNGSSSNFKQLEISWQGKLLKPLPDNNSSTTSIYYSYCGSCSQSIGVLTCAYCDLKICESCLNFCYKCKKGFCKSCSMNEYKIVEEEVVCLSCI